MMCFFLVLKEVIDIDTHMGSGIVQLDLFILLTWLCWTCIYLYYFREHGLRLLPVLQ
jgi:hypothetical protein